MMMMMMMMMMVVMMVRLIVMIIVSITLARTMAVLSLTRSKYLFRVAVLTDPFTRLNAQRGYLTQPPWWHPHLGGPQRWPARNRRSLSLGPG